MDPLFWLTPLMASGRDRLENRGPGEREVRMFLPTSSCCGAHLQHYLPPSPAHLTAPSQLQHSVFPFLFQLLGVVTAPQCSRPLNAPTSVIVLCALPTPHKQPLYQSLSLRTIWSEHCSLLCTNQYVDKSESLWCPVKCVYLRSRGLSLKTG